MVGASPIGGRLTDRIGPRRSALIGSSVLLSGSLMLCRLADFDTPAGALLPLLVFGIGMGLCSAPAQTSCMAAVKPAQAGMAAGASSTARYLGGIATILVLGAVLGSSASATVGQHEVMQWLFAGAVLISVGAGFYLPGQFRDGRPR
jgi:MFS family permease